MPPPRKPSLGFTLAEVLITLGIIGVVAVLTISHLVTNYQKQVTVTKLKAAYQLFSEAIENAKLNFGDPIEIPHDIVLSHAGFSPLSDEILERYINPYIIGVEKYKGRMVRINNTAKDRAFAVNDYSHMYCIPQKEICYDIYNHSTNYRYLFIDINGPKGPNSMGRDCFIFDLSPAQKAPTYVITGLAPIDKDEDSYCNKISNNNIWNGTSCAAKIILNSWKMPDDYPW